MKQFKKLTLLSVAVSSAMVLSACSNGNSSSNKGQKPSILPQKNEISAEMKESVQIVPTKDIKNIVQVKDGHLALPITNEFAKTLKNDDIVFIPADNVTGSLTQFGFAGKVKTFVENGITYQKLEPALIEEVYDKISWDLDTERQQSHIVGLIVPKNATAEFKQTPKTISQSQQVGLKIEEGGLELKGLTLEGKLKISHDFCYTGKYKKVECNNNDNTVKKITLSSDINIKDLALNSKADFDVTRLAMNTSGWAYLSATTRGNISADTKFVTKKSELDFGEMVTNTDVWNGMEKRELLKIFSIEGVKADDKKGKIPLGGVIISIPTATATVFKKIPDSAITLSSIPPTAYLWLYMDINGNISIEGEAGLRLRDYGFEAGYALEGQKFAGLGVKKIAKSYGDGVTEVYANGKASLSQNIGLSVGADLLLFGVRPFTSNVFAGGKLTHNLAGSATYQILPKNNVTGTLCTAGNIWAGIDYSVNYRIKADKDFWGASTLVDVNNNISDKIYTMLEKDFKKDCSSSEKIIFDAKLKSGGKVNEKGYYPFVITSESFKSGAFQIFNDKKDGWKLSVATIHKKGEGYDVERDNHTGEYIAYLPKQSQPYTMSLWLNSDTFGQVKSSDAKIIVVDEFNKTKISNVTTTPDTLSIGQDFELAISGTDLSSNTMFKVDGCHNQRKVSMTPTQHIYKCTAPTMATKNHKLVVFGTDGKQQYYSTKLEIHQSIPISANVLEFLSEPRYYLESDNSRYGKFLFTKGAYNNGMTSYVLNDVEYQKNGNKWIIDGENRDNLKVKGNDIFLEENNTFIGKAIVSKINDLSTQGFPKGAKSYNILLTNLQDEYDIFDNENYIYQNIGSIDNLLNNYQTINQSSGNTLWLDNLVNGYEAVFTFDKSSNQTSGTIQIYQANYKNGNFQQTKLGTGTWQRVKVNGNDMIKVQPSKALYSKFDDLNQDGVARIYVKRPNERGVREGEFRAKGVQDNDLFYNKIAINHLMNKNKLPAVVD